MRRIVSSGSVKAIYIDKKETMEQLHKVARDALREFPEIEEIRLFGSLARNEETGLSDVDILIIAETDIENPIERAKPYFFYFSEMLPIALDLIVATREEQETVKEIIGENIILAKRPQSC